MRSKALHTILFALFAVLMTLAVPSAHANLPENRVGLSEALHQGLAGVEPFASPEARRVHGDVSYDFTSDVPLASKWTSKDPLVGDLANKIDELYPGHVKGVNVPMYDTTGKLVTDADILLDNAVLQIKSGGGKGMAGQLLRTQGATDLPVIGYGPTLKPSVVSGAERAGSLITTDKDLLLEVIKP